MLKEFKEETGITVKTLPTSWDDIKSKVSIAAAGKKAAADIIEVDWSWIGEFQSAGWLEPLEINEDTQKDILSLDYFKVDGKYYAMPHFNDLRVAYINKEMLKKAGSYIGEAFQIRDDYLDIVADEKELGKPTHSDEKNEKTTYVNIVGIDESLRRVESLSADAKKCLKEVRGNMNSIFEIIDMMVNRTS